MANAEVIRGEGEYRFGPDTAENVACRIAEDRAKQNAIQNFIGEYIEHQTNEVCRDQTCTTFKSFFSETSGEIKRIVNKNSIVAPEKGYSVCIVEVDAEIVRVKNSIKFTVKGESEFSHGDRFSLSAISNRSGKFAVYNLIDESYRLVYEGKITRTNSEFTIPKANKFQALLPVGRQQSKEMLVFVFTEKDLTFQPRYSKIEFEQMVNELSFTSRKLVNHPINIMR